MEVDGVDRSRWGGKNKYPNIVSFSYSIKLIN